MSDRKDEFTRYKEKAQAATSNHILEDFRTFIQDEVNARSEDVQPYHSFWYHRPTRDFPPRSILYPTEYNGGDRINVVCTQTELKDSEQRRLVQSWCETLPGLDEVEFIWFSSRATQELFDACCEMKNLKGLYIKWSGIKSIDKIPKAQKLKYLHIGSSPSLAPLEPLKQLPQLEWLELENIRACADLEFTRELGNLKGLAITGDGNSLKFLKTGSLKPLTHLQNLYWLHLGTFKVEDGGLMPLAKLRSLKYLFISSKYKMEEIASLAGARPDIECDRFEPISEVYDFFACKKCGEKKMVLPTGKGQPWMCVDCDSEKIQKHIDKFNKIVNEYRRWTDKG